MKPSLVLHRGFLPGFIGPEAPVYQVFQVALLVAGGKGNAANKGGGYPRRVLNVFRRRLGKRSLGQRLLAYDRFVILFKGLFRAANSGNHAGR
jgi:hypothetical protein